MKGDRDHLPRLFRRTTQRLIQGFFPALILMFITVGVDKAFGIWESHHGHDHWSGHLPWDCIKWQDFRVECSEHLQICSRSGRCFFFRKTWCAYKYVMKAEGESQLDFFSIDIRFKDWLLWLFTLFVPKMGLYQSWKGKEIKLDLHRKLKCLLSEFEHVMSGSCQIKDVPLKLNTSQQSMHCCHLSLNLSAR